LPAIDSVARAPFGMPGSNDPFLPFEGGEDPISNAGIGGDCAPGQGREVVRPGRRPHLRQRVLFCRCGSTSIYVRGLCRPCYHREWADQKHYAGLREQVLARDQHRCRGCETPSIETVLVVHHRQPGRSSLDLMVTLCPACHAVVERTQVLFRDVPELLRVLWRELHPAASEQLVLFAS
jgi:5-methylcytosine-specific restriction endonuclease McrA